MTQTYMLHSFQSLRCQQHGLERNTFIHHKWVGCAYQMVRMEAEGLCHHLQFACTLVASVSICLLVRIDASFWGIFEEGTNVLLVILLGLRVVIDLTH